MHSQSLLRRLGLTFLWVKSNFKWCYPSCCSTILLGYRRLNLIYPKFNPMTLLYPDDMKKPHRNSNYMYEVTGLYDMNRVNEFRRSIGLPELTKTTRNCIRCDVRFESYQKDIRMCDDCRWFSKFRMEDYGEENVPC